MKLDAAAGYLSRKAWRGKSSPALYKVHEICPLAPIKHTTYLLNQCKNRDVSRRQFNLQLTYVIIA